MAADHPSQAAPKKAGSKKRRRSPMSDADKLRRSATRNQRLQRSHHQRLAIGATAVAFGLAIVGTGESAMGAALAVIGLLGLMASIHYYGRLGKAR